MKILQKISFFKFEENDKNRIISYILENNERYRNLRYQFALENDPLTLKVLCQILYEEVENLIYNHVLAASDSSQPKRSSAHSKHIRHSSNLNNSQNSQNSDNCNEFDGEFISIKKRKIFYLIFFR